MKQSEKDFQRPMIKFTKGRSLTKSTYMIICENAPAYSDKTPAKKAQPLGIILIIPGFFKI